MKITAKQFIEMVDSDETLPDDLVVDGWLDLNHSKIKKLPTNLTVAGSLYLQNAKIKELPTGLSVGENLDLNHSKIKKLPDDLSVSCCIYLRNTKINNVLYIDKIGHEDRPAFVFKNQGVPKITCGCFYGSKQQALDYIKNKDGYTEKEVIDAFTAFAAFGRENNLKTPDRKISPCFCEPNYTHELMGPDKSRWCCCLL